VQPGDVLYREGDECRDFRRSMLLELGAGFRIIGSRYSPDTRRLREFAARNRLPHRWIDLEWDKEAEALLRELAAPSACRHRARAWTASTW
jgi:hypothetical protein